MKSEAGHGLRRIPLLASTGTQPFLRAETRGGIKSAVPKGRNTFVSRGDNVPPGGAYSPK